MNTTPTFASLAGMLALLGPSAVHADALDRHTNPGGYSVRFVDRPIQLRGGMVRVDARYQVARIDVGGAELFHQIGAGAAVGITDGVEFSVSHERNPGIDSLDYGGLLVDVGANRGSFRDRLGNVNVAGRFALVQAPDFDLSAELAIGLPTHDGSAYHATASLPLRARLAERFALDLAPTLDFVFLDAGTGDGLETDFHLNVPVSGVLQLGDVVFLAGRSGLYWELTNDAGLFEAFHFPLFVEAGFTVRRGGTKPALDLSVEAGFPRFVAPGASDALGTEFFVARVNLSAFFGG